MIEVGIQTSADQGKLAGALAKAQGAFLPVVKDRTVKVKSKSTGVEYTFAYAQLETVISATRPALAANGLAILQEISGGDVKVCTTTMLHESGEWRSSTVEIPGTSESAQEFGSRVSYIRRYTYQGIVMVAAEDDDDGNVADGNTASWKDRRPAPTTRPRDTGLPAPKAASAAPAASEQPVETLLLKAGHQKAEIQRWLMSLWKTANWKIFTLEQVHITETLGKAWAEGGDDGHAKAWDAMKGEIEAARKVTG